MPWRVKAREENFNRKDRYVLEARGREIIVCCGQTRGERGHLTPRGSEMIARNHLRVKVAEKSKLEPEELMFAIKVRLPGGR
jgi:hypothetical protein